MLGPTAKSEFRYWCKEYKRTLRLIDCVRYEMRNGRREAAFVFFGILGA